MDDMDARTDRYDATTGRLVRIMDGREIVFDGEGYFDDFDDWSEAVFEMLAIEQGLSRITDQHRLVIHFLRKFYAYHGRAPLNRQFREGTGLSLMEMEQIFPGGLKQGARRLSGLPNPKTCS